MPRNTINPEETRTLSCPGFLSKNPATSATDSKILSAKYDSCCLSEVIKRFKPGIIIIFSTMHLFLSVLLHASIILSDIKPYLLNIHSFLYTSE
ncbi:MAG: hypothetical protein K1W15_04605 [Lachnospiraceae bacterium]